MEPFQFEIRAAVLEDYKDMKILCDERYGEGYLTPERYAHYLEHPRLFLVASQGNELAGFSLMAPASVPETADYMKMSAGEIKGLAGDRKILILKSIVIQKKYGKMGLPSTMTNAVIENAKTEGYGIIFSAAWMVEGKMPIKQAFEEMGFQPLFLRHNLWYDEEDYYCVVCKGRCKCDGFIYYRYI